ncbi:MAG: IS4 family transposase [Proteobacteria bacterium]|nr:IS4 family transposase [Pseudomonadota bacterium]
MREGRRRRAETDSWVDREIAACEFADARLGRRFRDLLGQIGDAVGESIPMACQDWANAKAAYRFFSNDRVNEADILSGHFEATNERFAATDGPILVLHDTTEFSFQRDRTQPIGITHKVFAQRDKRGRPRLHTVCGILMHSSLALTPEGLPLGIAAIKFWSRKKFKGCNALKKKINPTRVPIEKKESIRWLENLRQSTATLDDPARCVHIGDRESDIYELFCAAQEIGTHFLVRTCVDRLAGDGNHTVADDMAKAKLRGQHRIEVRDVHGNPSIAVIDIKFEKLRLLPPIGKQKQYPPLELTVIHAQERGKPKNRKPIDWKLITDLPVKSCKDAIEKLQWYALRWKIEVFHKILKSGCKAEDSKLRTAERLVNLISVFCIVSWRIFWMTMLNRAAPHAAPTLALTATEINLLDRFVPDKAKPSNRKSISRYLIKIARLGGYLARANDPAPGNIVMWRGLSRLANIEMGASAGRNCG